MAGAIEGRATVGAWLLHFSNFAMTQLVRESHLRPQPFFGHRDAQGGTLEAAGVHPYRKYRGKG